MYVRLYFKINFSGCNIFLAWYNTGSVSDTSAYPARKQAHDVGSFMCLQKGRCEAPSPALESVAFLHIVSGVRRTCCAAVAAGLTVLLLDEHRRLRQAAQVGRETRFGDKV